MRSNQIKFYIINFIKTSFSRLDVEPVFVVLLRNGIRRGERSNHDVLNSFRQLPLDVDLVTYLSVGYRRIPTEPDTVVCIKK